MSQKFIKFIPDNEAEFLLSKYPFAAALLQLIAIRARRIPGLPDGLEVGECFLGDHKSIGATRGQYRHALKVLENRAHIKITETCRTRKKTTTKATTVGTKVKLLSSSVWDINAELNDHRHDQPTTTEQPPNNHKEERIRKNKNINTCPTSAAPSDRTLIFSNQKETGTKQNSNLSKIITPSFGETKKLHNSYYQSNSPKKQLKINDLHLSLASLLLSRLKEIHPKIKEPNLGTWAMHIERMMHLDKRSESDIKSVIEWVARDKFWCKNILSTEKIREKFDQLWIAMNNDKTTKYQSFKEKINKRFTNREVYRGYEFSIGDTGICFTAMMGQSCYQLKFSERGFMEQFDNLVRKLGIE